MELLLALLLLAVAGVVLVRLRRASLPLLCLLVIVVGCCWGHAFWNRDLGKIPITLDRLLWAVVAIAFVISLWSGRVRWRRLSASDWLVGALLGALAFSTLAHDWSYRDHLPLSRLLFFHALPVGLYVFVRHCRLNETDVRWMFGLLGGFGVYLSWVSIADAQGWTALVYPSFILSPEHTEFWGRARGPLLNPVSCGIFQIVCFTAVWMWWPRLGVWGRALILLAAPLFLLGIFLTLTRSVWVGAMWAALVLAWLPATWRTRGALLCAATAASVIGLALFAPKLNAFKRDRYVSQQEMAQSAALRPMLATVAWKMFQDRPLVGHGFGQYSQVSPPYHYASPAGMPLQKVLPYMQHNVFLSYLTETGLLGMGLLVALLLVWSAQAWRLWRCEQQPWWKRQWALMAMVVLGNFVINGMFHDVSIIPLLGALLMLVAGVLGNICDSDGADQPDAEATTSIAAG